MKTAIGNGKNTCLYHVPVGAELRKFQGGSQFPDPSSQFSVVRREGSWWLAFTLQISHGGSRRLAREKNKKRSPEAGCRGMWRDMAGWTPATSNKPERQLSALGRRLSAKHTGNKLQATSRKLKAKKGRICLQVPLPLGGIGISPAGSRPPSGKFSVPGSPFSVVRRETSRLSPS
jgi:hypothetical protein